MKFITILQRGGGLPDLLQYYKGEGGVSRDPKFVLRNIWTAPNHNIPSGNEHGSLDQDGSNKFANNDVSPEMKSKEDAEEEEAQVVKEVQSKETSVLMKNQIHAEKDQAVVKKGKRGDYVDVEEEEEEKAIAPPTLVSMKPKLTRKNSQRK